MSEDLPGVLTLQFTTHLLCKFRQQVSPIYAVRSSSHSASPLFLLIQSASRLVYMLHLLAMQTVNIRHSPKTCRRKG